MLFGIVIAAMAVLGYAGYSTESRLNQELSEQEKQNKILTAQLDQANSRIADLKSKMEITTQRVGLTQSELAQAKSRAESIRKEQQASDEKITEQLGQVQKESEEKIGAVATEVGGAKKDIETTKSDLEATKGKLDRSLGDMNVMSGLIAHNRETPRRPQLLRVHSAKIQDAAARRTRPGFSQQDRSEKSKIHGNGHRRRQDHRKEGQNFRRARAVLCKR